MLCEETDRVTPLNLGGMENFNPLSAPLEKEFFIDNLLVRIHFIIVMIRWTGLASWEFEFPFPGSLASTFLWPPFFLSTVGNPTPDPNPQINTKPKKNQKNE